jgi:UDP-2,3-diacylglucosamine hydrolase
MSKHKSKTKNKPIHIISDLHLTQSRPDLFELFKHYMQKIAPQSKQMYVLGDLFELWIGDDCLLESNLNNNPESPLYLKVIDLFKNYAENHGELFFIHGNRDFLLADQFEKKSKGLLLSEPFLTSFDTTKIALMHGDSLCTDDTDYQQFRSMVRSSQWQNEFLAMSIEQRIKIADGLRKQSQESQSEKTMDIMDVNQQAVSQFFKDNNINWLIHGHTHRQASHQHHINNKDYTRVVLSDWDDRGFYLSILDNEISEHYFNL